MPIVGNQWVLTLGTFVVARNFERQKSLLLKAEIRRRAGIFASARTRIKGDYANDGIDREFLNDVLDWIDANRAVSPSSPRLKALADYGSGATPLTVFFRTWSQTEALSERIGSMQKSSAPAPRKSRLPGNLAFVPASEPSAPEETSDKADPTSDPPPDRNAAPASMTRVRAKTAAEDREWSARRIAVLAVTGGGIGYGLALLFAIGLTSIPGTLAGLLLGSVSVGAVAAKIHSVTFADMVRTSLVWLASFQGFILVMSLLEGFPPIAIWLGLTNASLLCLAAPATYRLIER